MSYFAEIENGVVKRVIAIDQENLNTGRWGDPANWIQTSYNTFGGVHKLGGTPLRKNFASTGYVYDKARDAFIPPKLYNSWVLDEFTCQYKAPKDKPKDDKTYDWNEASLNWIERKTI